MDTKSSEMQHLNDLADRVTSLEVQIVQLGDEMRAEFSATRAELRKEMRDGDDETRRTLGTSEAEQASALMRHAPDDIEVVERRCQAERRRENRRQCRRRFAKRCTTVMTRRVVRSGRRFALATRKPARLCAFCMKILSPESR